jgi:hypothetical protein
MKRQQFIEKWNKEQNGFLRAKNVIEMQRDLDDVIRD